MPMRLHLLCAASTSSINAVSFAADERLDSRGRDSLARLSRLPRCDTVLRSRVLCTAQRAEGLALDSNAEPLLRDCDYGRWAGRSVAAIYAQAPEAAVDWMENPQAPPHGGESFAEVLARVPGWIYRLLARQGSVLAVTHAPVIRAVIDYAVGAGPTAFRHVDVGPSGEGQAIWRRRTLGSLGRS